VSEQFTNSAQTSLNGAITNTDTLLTVVSASLFPNKGNFRILIDSEIIKVTSVSGSQFTILRGQESTSAASHVDGSVITEIVTADALSEYRKDYFNYGTAAARPAAGIKGRLYYGTDCPLIWQDDGIDWWLIYPVQTPTKDRLTLSDWSWRNQSTSTVTDYNGAFKFTFPTGVSYIWRYIYKALAFSSPFTINMCVWAGGVSDNADGENLSGNLIIAESPIGGKLMAFGQSFFSYANLKFDNWTNETTFFGHERQNGLLNRRPLWLQYKDSGTVVSIAYSLDGGATYIDYNYQNVRNGFLTPAYVGFGSAITNNRWDDSCWLLALKESSP
jgi:hypothetical protein